MQTNVNISPPTRHKTWRSMRVRRKCTRKETSSRHPPQPRQDIRGHITCRKCVLRKKRKTLSRFSARRHKHVTPQKKQRKRTESLYQHWSDQHCIHPNLQTLLPELRRNARIECKPCTGKRSHSSAVSKDRKLRLNANLAQLCDIIQQCAMQTHAIWPKWDANVNRNSS